MSSSCCDDKEFAAKRTYIAGRVPWVEDQVNTYIVHTVQLLNNFSALCEQKLAEVHRYVLCWGLPSELSHINPPLPTKKIVLSAAGF